jgi:malate dehydrogenase (oxaloacetate-decarboxylating)
VKTFSFKIDPLTGEDYYEVYIRGRQLINDPLLNKQSAFSQEERLSLGLDGLVRAHVSTMEEQIHRCEEAIGRKTDDLEKYIYLQSLLDRSEVLFYRLLYEHLEELVPIVYTPIVGQACMNYSHLQRRYRGLYISPENIGAIDNIFQAVSLPTVNLIVVTDGERILGLGDLGSDGMGIPVGKVNLYVAAGGVHPAVTMPITLDVGTNNERLLRDPLYLGYKHPRLDGKEYAAFIEKFVLGVRRNFPEALLQWEDFAKHKAFVLLERYRDRILSFNDDIQGTGATALSSLMTAMRIKKQGFKDQRFVIVGMGQAGVGIARNIRAALLAEGLSEEEARRHIFAVDQWGLLLDDFPALEAPQRPFAQPREALCEWEVRGQNEIGLMDVVKNSRATVLIGVTAKPKLFDDAILNQMAKNTERPIILALSNPTSKCEATLEDVARATGGKGLMASGSPYAPVDWKGKQMVASQCNNLFIFPGVGLGALVAKAQKVTDQMFLAASKALSAMVTPEEMERGMLLPDMKNIRQVSYRVAKAVCIEARDSGLGRLLSDEELDRVIKRAQWEPQYSSFRAGPCA